MALIWAWRTETAVIPGNRWTRPRGPRTSAGDPDSPSWCSGVRVVTSAIRPESETIPCASALERASEARHAPDGTPPHDPQPTTTMRCSGSPAWLRRCPAQIAAFPTEASARLASAETTVSRPERARGRREAGYRSRRRSGRRVLLSEQTVGTSRRHW